MTDTAPYPPVSPYETNGLGQPLDQPVPNWRGCPRPPRTPMQGRTCRVEPLDVEKHAEDLFKAVSLDRNGVNWTYLPYGPFDKFADYLAWLEATCTGDDPFFHTTIDQETGKAVGIASLMRIDPPNGVIETGHIHFSPAMQRGPASTETMYLMMRRVFDELGYRRYEWKCNNLNDPSKRAAVRLGFTFEGVFRQMSVTKGRNRNTAWFSILDSEWPAQKAAFESWLDPENFDGAGRQKRSLSEIKASVGQGCN